MNSRRHRTDIRLVPSPDPGDGNPGGIRGNRKLERQPAALLRLAGCEIETATSVGVPTTERRVFVVVAGKKSGDYTLNAKLCQWKKNVERPAPATPTVGAFLERRGSFFLKRGHQAKEIFSFKESAVTITREHIMGRNPIARDFTARRRDAASLEEAQELCREDYAKLTTTQDNFDIPPTLRRCDSALVMQEKTLAPMLREILSLLQLRGWPKRKMDGSQGEQAREEEQLAIDLASLLQEEKTIAAVTRGATRTAAHRVDRSQFKVTPAMTRSVTRRAQQPAEATSPRPRQKGGPSKTRAPATTQVTNSEEAQMSTPREVETPTPTTEDVNQSTASDQTDQRQSVCRGHSEQLEHGWRVS